MAKYILGLDLGPNSIGWAVVEGVEQEEHVGLVPQRIVMSGSRIIPIDKTTLSNFETGNTVSQTADRTQKRGMRRNLERKKLRRQRLFRVLKTMGMLPRHFAEHVDGLGNLDEDGRRLSMAWAPQEGERPLFLFQDAFAEMVGEFAARQPQLMLGGKLVPKDWTLYYLRKKGLTDRLEKEELAWVLASFLQKRGYRYMRGQDADNTKENEKKELRTLEIVDLISDGDGSKKGKGVDLVLEDELRFTVKNANEADFKRGQTLDFIVTTTYDERGKVKMDANNKPMRKLSMPKEGDWELLKTRTEQRIRVQEGSTVGSYIYESILENPDVKIIGERVHVVGREFYEEETKRILEAQTQFHPELSDPEMRDKVAHALYPNNEAHRNAILNRSLADIIVADVVFYQRPLRSKKSSISDCPFEKRNYVGSDGEERKVGVKCISKSHPLFQEFRTWQFVGNVKLVSKDDSGDDKNLSLLGRKKCFNGGTCEEGAELFEWLHNRKSVKQGDFLKGFVGLTKGEIDRYYRWNYEADKEIPCCETRAEFLGYFKKAGLPADALTEEAERRLWEVAYSVSDREEFRKALRSYARWIGADEERFVEAFGKMKPFPSDYGSYSEKAIKKLLPLMRTGKYWSFDAIAPETQSKIRHLITGEEDERLTDEVREHFKYRVDEANYQGLQLWEACELVYGSSFSKDDIAHWKSPDDLDRWLEGFRQHSLRNPIVEQVVLEAVRTVRDIWRKIGHIDEIHLEMARDMRKTAQERKRDSERNSQNFKARQRIKMLLDEFEKMRIDDVHPYSPMHQEKLRIVEDGVFDRVSAKGDEKSKEMLKDMRAFQTNVEKNNVTPGDISRYMLYLEQNYRSPYTNETISMKRLFSSDYEIEHVIPRSRFFDDSMSNKVICEAKVNKEKGNMTGMEFIMKRGGEKIELGEGREVTIVNEKDYRQYVDEVYKNNSRKRKNLLSEDIPGGFSNSQMNNTRYISRLVMTILSNIVRDDREDGKSDEGIRANRLITCQGGVTDKLKKDWHVNDVWNRIILPRYERMQNEVMKGVTFVTNNSRGHEIPTMPDKLKTEEYNPKRIDHRHHAMDAIVIACATRSIVNFLNNESARDEASEGSEKAKARQTYAELRSLLCVKDADNDEKVIRKPWENFEVDVLKALEDIVVSTKHKQRVLTRTSNHYEKFVDGKKQKVSQKGKSYAVRLSLHKDTVWGQVNLRRQEGVSLLTALKDPQRVVDKALRKKIVELQAQGKKPKDIKKYFAENADVWPETQGKVAVWHFTDDEPTKTYATRFISSLTELFDKISTREKAEEKIQSITDTGIQKILLAHLAECNYDVAEAFSPIGIERMNANIVALNGGKQHKPIKKVRRTESGSKFAVGASSGSRHKFVENAKGGNLFFAVYLAVSEDKNGNEVRKRQYETLPLRTVLDRLKQGLSPVPEVDEGGNRLLFSLCPYDLVYVPKEGENVGELTAERLDKERIYMFVSSSDSDAMFRPHRVAAPIVEKKEFTLHNKMSKAVTGEMIKEVCIPLEVDRLGDITKKRIGDD